MSPDQANPSGGNLPSHLLELSTVQPQLKPEGKEAQWLVQQVSLWGTEKGRKRWRVDLEEQKEDTQQNWIQLKKQGRLHETGNIWSGPQAMSRILIIRLII